MSVTRKMYTTITCDGCNILFDESGFYSTTTEAVNVARDHGWDCTDGKHFCEDCLFDQKDETSLEGPVGLTP